MPNKQKDRDAETWANVAPQIAEALGFVPRDGIVSVLSASFSGERETFELARDLIAEIPVVPDAPRQSTEGYLARGRKMIAFDTAHRRLLREINRYQQAAAQLYFAAELDGNLSLSRRAAFALAEYTTFSATVAKVNAAAIRGDRANNPEQVEAVR